MTAMAGTVTASSSDENASSKSSGFFLSNHDSLSAGTTTTTSTSTMTIPDAIAWIDQYCDRRFWHAVVASDYRFLYRGILGRNDAQKIEVRTETPDLLLPETYGNDDEALRFFTRLQDVLADDAVRPDNGHLATTSAHDAAAWGTAASIWPASSSSSHYAWFQTGGLFYPRPLADSLVDRTGIIVDGRDCGKDGLEDALGGDGWEILVATPRFLAVPACMDAELRKGLRSSFLV